MNGIYTMRAISVVASQILGKDGNKVEYFKNPMIEQMEIDNRPLTEADKEEMTNQLFLRLKILQDNFKNTH